MIDMPKKLKKGISILLLIVCSTSVVYAQPGSTKDSIKNNSVQLSSTKDSNKFHQNKFIKDTSNRRFLYFGNKQQENKKGKVEKKGEKRGKENVDSIQILKDSIAALNTTIKNLQKQSKPKRQTSVELQRKVDSLQKELVHRDKIISDKIVETFGQQLYQSGNTDNDFYCYAVMESPLYYNYDEHRIKQSLYVAKAMGYDAKGHKFNRIYNTYYDLLINYRIYNQELIDNINAIIDQFSMGTPSRELERERFENRLSTSKYYNVRGKGKNGTYRHIFYLDYQIELLRELFKSDKTFKKANFLEIRDAL